MSVKAEAIGKPRIRLEMDYDEAVTLKSLTGHVVGGNTKKYSKHTDDIYDALELAGVESKDRVKSSSNGVEMKE